VNNIRWFCECQNIQYNHQLKSSFCVDCGLEHDSHVIWSLTAEDVGRIFQIDLNEHTGEIERCYFDPPTNKYGYQQFIKHINKIEARFE
jgi:hypothetical protein